MTRAATQSERFDHDRDLRKHDSAGRGAMWTERERGSGFELDTGAMRLDVTDQCYRGAGWCWHVSAEHTYGSDALGQGGGLASADEAKRTACAWAREFCEKTIAAIAKAEAAR